MNIGYTQATGKVIGSAALGPGVAVDTSPVLNAHLVQCVDLMKQLENTSDRIAAFISRTYGAGIIAGEQSYAVPAPSGILAEITTQLNALDRVASRLWDQACTLDRIG